MNLKEAFRYQNKIMELVDGCRSILCNDKNITKTKCTHLRKKVMEGAENEVIVEQAPSEDADRINDVIKMLMNLLAERERLFAAIHEAKAKLDIDFDAENSLNNLRHQLALQFRHMADIRSSEVVTPNGGYGFRFNTDGNQISYKCDLERVTAINFDRNMVRDYAAKLGKDSDEMSTRLDQILVNTIVDYTPPFDVNDTFADVFNFFNPGLDFGN